MANINNPGIILIEGGLPNHEYGYWQKTYTLLLFTAEIACQRAEEQIFSEGLFPSF